MQGWRNRRRVAVEETSSLNILPLCGAEALFLIDNTRSFRFDNIPKGRGGVPITTSTCPFKSSSVFCSPAVETRHLVDPHWEILHPLHKGIVMLLRQFCIGARNYATYFAFLEITLNAAQREISAPQIRRSMMRRLSMSFFCRPQKTIQLILRLVKREHFLDSSAQTVSGPILVALAALASRIKLDNRLQYRGPPRAHLCSSFYSRCSAPV